MNHFEIVLALIVLVMASARVTRLIVFDTYPPSAKLRAWWHNLTGDGEWSKLVDCHYCAAPYVTATLMALGLWVLPVSVPFSDGQTWWWLIAGWLGASYAASIVVSYDGDD